MSKIITNLFEDFLEERFSKELPHGDVYLQAFRYAFKGCKELVLENGTISIKSFISEPVLGKDLEVRFYFSKANPRPSIETDEHTRFYVSGSFFKQPAIHVGIFCLEQELGKPLQELSSSRFEEYILEGILILYSNYLQERKWQHRQSGTDFLLDVLLTPIELPEKHLAIIKQLLKKEPTWNRERILKAFLEGNKGWRGCSDYIFVKKLVATLDQNSKTLQGAEQVKWCSLFTSKEVFLSKYNLRLGTKFSTYEEVLEDLYGRVNVFERSYTEAAYNTVDYVFSEREAEKRFQKGHHVIY